MELLESKVTIQEEAPQTPAVTPVVSGTGLCLGLCERGPINDPQMVTSEDEYERIFGIFTATSEVAKAIRGFFNAGGSRCWVNRIVHYTDLTDPAAHTALKGQVNLLNSGSVATPGSVTGTVAQNWDLRQITPKTLDITTDVGGPTTTTLLGAAAFVTDTTTYPVTGGTGVLQVKIDRGITQDITFAGTEVTALECAATINDQLIGGSAVVSGGQIVITSDKIGTGSYVEIVTNPAANPLLTFPTSEVQGTGNVADMSAVTGAEIETAVEAAVADVAVTVNPNGTLTFANSTTGSTKTIQIVGTSGLDTTLGLDNEVHTGTDATPANTLQVDGKYFGAYTATVQVVIAVASNGEAEYFNIQVLKGGVVKEVFPNVTMDDTSVDFVETRVNDADAGSRLIAVTDLDTAGTPTVQRPANGTSGYMTGGDDGLTSLAEADYLGNAAGPTGLFAFNTVSEGRILFVPGLATATGHKAMMDYAETTREGSMICVLDPPAGQTAQQMVTFVTNGGLVNYSEFGALYWPRIKVVNPSTSVFGTDNTITVPPSGYIAGLYGRNDGRTGGVYESPAGFEQNWGVIPGMTGPEDDPSGLARHEVLDRNKRGLVYPKRINPISKLDNTPWFIDGGRTLKSTGSFPNVGERRGVIFIEQSIKAAMEAFRHRYNNPSQRRKANRMITAFLTLQMNVDAFRTRNPATAFRVDTSDQLNPLSAQLQGIMYVRVLLGTNKPAEYVVLTFAQDTRALQEELAAAQQ